MVWFPFHTHCQAKVIQSKGVWEFRIGSYPESPDLVSRKLSASGLLSACSQWPFAAPSSMSRGQGLASWSNWLAHRGLNCGLSQPPFPQPQPCLEPKAHTALVLLQQPTIFVAKLLQTSQNISAVRSNNETLLFCVFSRNCTFPLQAIISAAAAAEFQLDLTADQEIIYVAFPTFCRFLGWLVSELTELFENQVDRLGSQANWI